MKIYSFQVKLLSVWFWNWYENILFLLSLMNLSGKLYSVFGTFSVHQNVSKAVPQKLSSHSYFKPQVSLTLKSFLMKGRNYTCFFKKIFFCPEYSRVISKNGFEQVKCKFV
jgi:hypothetical protein